MQILGDGFVLKFTPQARGSTQFDMPPARRASIYPAGAGINPHLGQIVLICLHLPRMRGDHPQPIVAYTTFKDLPRVCGDQPGYTFVLDYWCEFPPRARGSTLVIALSADVVYIYPACAGITLLCPKGEKSQIIYPAGAGINLGYADESGPKQHLPRMRGDQP